MVLDSGCHWEGWDYWLIKDIFLFHIFFIDFSCSACNHHKKKESSGIKSSHFELFPHLLVERRTFIFPQKVQQNDVIFIYHHRVPGSILPNYAN